MTEETQIKSLTIITAQGIQKFTKDDHIIEKCYRYIDGKTVEYYLVYTNDYLTTWEIRCIDNLVIEYDNE